MNADLWRKVARRMGEPCAVPWDRIDGMITTRREIALKPLEATRQADGAWAVEIPRER